MESFSRRELLQGIAALGAGSLLQAQPANPRLIDIHRHFMSPAFLKVLNAKTGHKTEGFTGFFPLAPWKDYSPARDIETMDKQGIATSLVSTTSPGTWFGNRDETRGLAREMNEYGAKMASDYKGRFGLFALLPMPSVEDSLKEIEYAFDTLKADGVGLLTSYGNRWLGDPAFRPVFDELNRRKAVVYTHPIDAPCCQELMQGVTPTTLEFPTDTSRTIISLIASGAATRYADTRFVFSHVSSAALLLRYGYVDEPGADPGSEDDCGRVPDRVRDGLSVWRRRSETPPGAGEVRPQW
jgi:predicted TIM-barrel fold metal-dependent hydrolase